MWHLHLQSLMNNDFYVLIIVQSATSQGTCLFFKISSLTCAEFTSVLFVMGWLVHHHHHHHRSPFDYLLTLCTILWHTACLLLHHQMPLSTGGEFGRGKYISPINIKLHRELLHKIKLPESLPLHINVYHEQHLADWQNDRLTDSCDICGVVLLVHGQLPSEK